MKTKITQIFLMSLIFTSANNVVSGQAPSYSYAKSLYTYLKTRNLAYDNSGNSYIAGSRKATFSPYDNSATIGKFSSIGTQLWLKEFYNGNYNAEYNFAEVHVDANKNVLLVGRYTKFMIFGNAVGDTLFETGGSTNYTDLFIAKLDSNGNVLWKMNAGGNGDDSFTCSEMDSNGDIYILGQKSFNTFGTIVITPSIASSYLAKISSSGTVLWAVGLPQTIGTGDFAKIKSITPGNIDLFYRGAYNPTYEIMYHSSCDGANGNVLSLNDSILFEKLGNNSSLLVTHLDVNSGGNIFIGGNFVNGIVAGTDTMQTSVQATDFFVGKMDSEMKPIKFVQGGNPLVADNFYGLDVNTAGEPVILVDLYTKIIMENDSVTTTSLNYNLAVSQLDVNLKPKWFQTAFTSQGGLTGSDVQYDSNGDIVLAGEGKQFTCGTVLNSNPFSYQSSFIAKLGTSTGISEFGKTSNFILFPNPTSGKILINFNNHPTTPDGYSIELINFLGEKVYSAFPNELSNSEFDFSLFPKGIYFICIKNQENSNLFSDKIILE